MRSWRKPIILLVLGLFLLPLPSDGQDSKFRTRVLFDRRVPMRDGVELSADVYLPKEEGKYPVILIRTPYQKNGAGPLRRARYFTARGFAVVYMDVRGRGDSEGKFIPYRNDGLDGYDSIEWCATQPWSNGNIGMMGGSYLARIQWLAAVQNPPHLRAIAPSVTPSDPFIEWPTGQPIPMHISWLHYTSGHVNQNVEAVDWMQVYQHLPLLTMDEVISRSLPFWREEVRHAGLSAWYEPIRYQNKYHQVEVPAFNVSGWYDDEQVGTPLNFMGMTQHGKTEEARRGQKLLMGPWPHRINRNTKIGDVDFGPEAVINLDSLYMRWFDYWLKGKQNSLLDEPPVRIFVMGVNQWRYEHEWPLARTQWTKYYFRSQGKANTRMGDGMLSIKPAGLEPTDTYRYDPSAPVPFLTDPSFAQIGSTEDYREVEERRDVLVYTSSPVEKDVEVTGPIKVHLYAASSAKDTDFMAKLLDVWPDGYAQRLCDGMVRARFRNGMERQELIEPGKIYHYLIDCWNTSQVFKKGHRIRVEISSSAFPKYDRNLNTGEDLGISGNMQVVTQSIYHDKEHPSHIVLPVIP